MLAVLDASGSIVGGPIAIDGGGDGGAPWLHIHFDPHMRRYTALWVAETLVPPRREVRIQQLDDRGRLLGAARTIASPRPDANGVNVSAQSPDVVVGPLGRVVVVWVAADPPATAAGQNEVWAATFEPSALGFLPATGSDSTELALIGGAVLIIGVALTTGSMLVARRRRRN